MEYDNPRPSSQPVGSTDLAVAKDNLITHDLISVSDDDEVTNRKGATRKTLKGLESSADDRISAAILAAGYQFIGDFSDAIKTEVTERNQVYTSQSVTNLEDAVWRYTGTLPYTPTGSDPTQSPEDGKWQAIAIGELKSIARSLNVQDSDVIYSTDTVTVLDNVLYIYDASAQTTWGVPTLNGTGETITDVTDSDLTTTGGSYTLFVISDVTVTHNTLADAIAGDNSNRETVVIYDKKEDLYSANRMFIKTTTAQYTRAHASQKFTDAAGNKFIETTNRKKFVILATGQSNIEQVPAYTWTPPPNLKEWAWAGEGTTGALFTPMRSTIINHTYACAAVYAEQNPSVDVFVIKIGSGGKSIEHWLPSPPVEWDGYTDCKNNVEAALAIIGASKIDMFHWHQGESNVTDSEAAYINKWDTMLARFQAEAWMDESTSINVNGVSTGDRTGDSGYTFMNLGLKKICQNKPFSRQHIPTTDIVPDVYWADNLHLTGFGHYLLGTVEGQMIFNNNNFSLSDGFRYDTERGLISFGDQVPIGAAFEVNKGDDTNSETEISAVNLGTGALDIPSVSALGSLGKVEMRIFPTGSSFAGFSNTDTTAANGHQLSMESGATYEAYAGANRITVASETELSPGLDNTQTSGSPNRGYNALYLHDQTTGVARRIQLVNGVLVVT